MAEIKVSIPELEKTIFQALMLCNVPGAGVGVIKNGELISARGYGVKEAGKDLPVNAETNFAIGSNTKAFTAACIGTLVEEGKLAWDDKVIKYLPDFAVYDPWVTKEVTIRDILSHRIGVCDVERFLYNTTCSNAEVVRRLRYVKPTVPFRSDFEYSNISFMAAGEILKVVTGSSWETLVHERIFTPLGMNHSTTNFSDVRKIDNKTQPHVNRHYSGLLPMRVRMLDSVQPMDWYDFGSQAAGGITSNVMDMAKWIGMFLGNGTYQGKTIIKPETAAMMTHPTNLIQTLTGSMAALAAMSVDINFWTYGLGWFVFDYRGRKLVFHSGQVQGMVSLCGFMPQEKLGVLSS
jgi:CubicO group peptidase (beta-lactamase class C family)